jgi:hypothetical protein
VEGLQGADASIMPSIIGGNTNAATTESADDQHVCQRGTRQPLAEFYRQATGFEIHPKSGPEFANCRQTSRRTVVRIECKAERLRAPVLFGE